ncbi:YTH domain-containing protein ECT4 [Diospyros lotus]|uniref:YTH domain-containing protein ECT4 n=1 Tax=Diospyros lotus TaxID=55363 RepID=UPI002252ADC1|nr:YTH domain-containing protein ECT4 [Diospyros lotus]
MEEEEAAAAAATQQGRRDPISAASPSPPPPPPPGSRPVEPNLTEQSLASKDERIVSTSPPDAVVSAPSNDVTDQLESTYTSETLTTVYPQEQTYFYGGFENSTGNWDEYNRYVNANSLQVVSPAMFNENQSLLFHSGYGIDTQMAYGQFSPMASALSPIMLDGQLFSPQQIPVPPYFPQPVSPSVPHATSSLPMSQTELVTAGAGGQDHLGDNVLFGPGSGYYLHFGSLGGGGPSGEPLSNQSNSDAGSFLSPLTSPTVYPQPYGILGPYEHNLGQISQQQRPPHGFGPVANSSARGYPPSNLYQSSNYNTSTSSHWGANNRNRVAPDKGGRRERDRDSIFVSSHGIPSDRSRGPRASKPKSKTATEESSSSGRSKYGASISGFNLDLYNRPDFITDYENAKFFIIKSFSEDNVHKSIKYSVWASTPLGNRKLDAAYHEAKEIKDHCPVFLLFSVNASGQFCGVAEMVGPVDFENNADYWQQDRWSGQFPVRWHIIKDVPNSCFRHILLENNDNKPVTHSRDSQEVKPEQGIEMLKILKDHDAETSILEDFGFYDERETAFQERKVRQRARNASVADASVSQLAENFTGALQLEDGKEMPVTK